MENVKETITRNIQKTVRDLTGLEVNPQLEHPKVEGHGDYSTNVAMIVFRKYQVSGSKYHVYKTPFELAQDISKILNTKYSIQNTDRVEAVAPGFINLWLSKEYLTTLMIRIIRVKEDYGKSKKRFGKKIMLEFADPNPFKEFHIGHLRNITLGESYARLLESQGANVWRVNYQGDVGLHVAKALYGIFHLCHAELVSASRDKFGIASDILNYRIPKQVQDDSLSKRIKFLGEAYALGSKAYEEDKEAKKEIDLINIKIYKNDPSIGKIWEKGRKWSLEHFETIYRRLGTAYKRYYFESEVAEAGKKLVLDHIDDGVFEKSDGAVIFRGQKHGLHNRVFVTKEDYATYEAKDMALAPLKYKDFPYDKSIIITAHEQAPYFKVVLAAMRFVSPNLAEKTEHDSFGFVSLKEAKMSSRLGNIVRGEWLLDETKRRIKSQFREMDEETAEKVAVGAIKYSMLKIVKEADISFSFNESISLEGNSGPYLQYTFARTQSVLRKSSINVMPNYNDVIPEINSGQALNSFQDLVSNEIPKQVRNDNKQVQDGKNNIKPEELSILRTIHRFPEIVEEAGEKFTPNILCTYLFDLAQKFNLFYQKHKILGSKQKDFRLILAMSVGKVLKNGLDILGIKAPVRM